MEKRLFYLYLKYIEESCPSVCERLGKISKKLMAYLSCMVGFYVASVIFLLITRYLNGILSVVFTGFIIVFVILSIVFGCILFFETEKYEINVSDKTMEEYWGYCYGIRKWFQKDFLFDKEINDQTVMAITEIFAILLVLAILIGIIWVINSVSKLFKKQKIEQMKSFSEDLQGALDCIKYSTDFTEL